MELLGAFSVFAQRQDFAARKAGLSESSALLNVDRLSKRKTTTISIDKATYDGVLLVYSCVCVRVRIDNRVFVMNE